MAMRMDDHDGLVRQGLERLSHTTSRYGFLDKAAKGIFAAAATLALGGLGMQSAEACPTGGWGGCGCCSSTSHACQGCPSPGGPQQCPTYFSYCTPDMCSYCWYSNGYWSCPCNGKTSYCTDCIYPAASCGSACTCNAVR